MIGSFACVTEKKHPRNADFACTGGAKWDKTAMKWELVGNQIEIELFSVPPIAFQMPEFMINVWSSV